MRSHTGVAAQMFKTLADAEINIGMVTTSEIKISVLVDRDRCDDAVRAVHAGFSLDKAQSASPSIGQNRSASERSGGSRDELEQDVVAQLKAMEDIVVSDVQLDTHQARVTIGGLPDVPGVAASIFTAAAEGGAMVDMIVQNVSHKGEANLSFTSPRVDLERCLLLTRELLEEWPEAKLSYDESMAKLTVVGIGLRTHTGVGEKMFKALADAKINVQMINTSEIRMSAVVDGEQGKKAHESLLKVFGR
jgi:aspartate kinase